MSDLESWGRYPKARHQIVRPPAGSADTLDGDLFARVEGTMLAYGCGRSYGDVCLNDGGTLVHTAGLDRILSFDAERGVLACEAGVTLERILDMIVPRGWFLPVTPGTEQVTVGGAVANDVHGKNHHVAGTFGRHVRRLELLRSDGRRACSPSRDEGLFRATIGGMGLTGLVLRVEIVLTRVPGPRIAMETVRFDSLDEGFDRLAEADARRPYTLAWIDGFASGRELGRGVLMAGDHAPASGASAHAGARGRRLRVPFEMPEWLLRRAGVRAMSLLYFRRHSRARRERIVHYRPFFYPLDAVDGWNLLYGPRGLFEYQCVVPAGPGARAGIAALLGEVASSPCRPFLVGLKSFGDFPPAGLLSFPRAGYTLGMHFPNRGAPTLRLLDALDRIVVARGGAVYPAKDARMSAETFRASFPRWRELAAHRDPKFSSGFARRVGL